MLEPVEVLNGIPSLIIYGAKKVLLYFGIFETAELGRIKIVGIECQSRASEEEVFSCVTVATGDACLWF